ncbi:MAG: RNA polymerase factor sigma-54 [Planctomycetota bacterium]
MRFETSQAMKLGQQMKLAPRVIQSMEILQMPLAQLEERISEELGSNPVLDLAEPGSGDAGFEHDLDLETSGTHAEGIEARDDFRRLDDYQADNPDAAANEFGADNLVDGRSRFDEIPGVRTVEARMARSADSDGDFKADAMATAVARSASLDDQLLDQWRLADVDESLRVPGEIIIGFLDEDGYLRVPLEEVADKAPRDAGELPIETLERALTAVQLFLEPPGVAARDARECLLLQLDALEAGEGWDSELDRADTLRVARTLVDVHLDDLINNRLPKIADRSGLGLDDIKAGLMALRRLSLAPARRLVSEPVQAIVPDAIVEYDDEADRYVAYINDKQLPNLQINKAYADLVRADDQSQRDKDFVRTNLSNAQWLIDAVDQRKRTLQRVLNVVVDAQREVFDYGPEAIRPLPMTQVAEELGIHVATVSRAVADKHLMTPRGVLPLRRFFTGGTETESGEEISWEAVKAALQEVVDNENKAKPMSDEALAKAMKERGVDIARRTVAKYRAQLGIPSARLRREY